MPRTTTTSSKAAAATSFDTELGKLATSESDILVAKAMVADLGTSGDNEVQSCDNIVAALRTFAKGETRTDMSSKVTLWYVTASQVAGCFNTEHLTAITKAVTAASIGSAPKVSGPTPEQLIEDAILRYMAALSILGQVGAQIDASFDKDVAAEIRKVTNDMLPTESTATLSKLIDRASFLAKPMTGRKGATGPKAQIGRSLSNLTDGLTFVFKEVTGEIKEGKLVVDGESFDNPSRAACSVAKKQGTKNPSFNGWEAWKTSDGKKLASVHAECVDMLTTEPETTDEDAEAES